MRSPVIAVIGFVIALVVVAEIISLLQLRASLQTYATYWQKRSQESGQLTYVALGDSAAQGIGANQPQNGYAGQIAQRLEEQTGKTVRVVNLSVSGARIRNVINIQIPQLKNYQADYITIEAGANDIVSFDAEKYEIDFRQLASQLPKNTVVANMPNFGGRINRDGAVPTANRIIQSVTSEQGLIMADLYTSTRSNESLFNYSADFFHPNRRGYTNWANAFWDKLKDL